MRLVEQHIIKKADPRFNKIDEMAFASKNLWNLANYCVRQSFIFQGTYLNNAALYSQLKATDAYKALPAKVSNQVLVQLDKAWTAFFEAMQPWRDHPEKLTGRTNLPKYKPKAQGRNLLVFEMGAIWKADLAYGEIAVSQLGRLVETKQNPKAIDQVRIVPKADHYVVEVIYRREEKQEQLDPTLCSPGSRRQCPGCSHLQQSRICPTPAFRPSSQGMESALQQRASSQTKEVCKRKSKALPLSPLRSDHDEAQPPCHALPAYGQPSHH